MYCSDCLFIPLSDQIGSSECVIIRAFYFFSTLEDV